MTLPPSLDLDPSNPDWISLHQALLVRDSGMEPIPENQFRHISGFPPPDNPEEKRHLVLGLALGRICHTGALYHMRSEVPQGRRRNHRYHQPIKIICAPYSAERNCWLANNLCFASSMLYLEEPPPEFNGDRVDDDFFALRNIVVRREDVETPHAIGKRTATGGRPPKSAGREKILLHAAAHIAEQKGLPRRKAELVAVLQEFSDCHLKGNDHLGKTTLEELVRDIFKEHDRLINE